jgi:hypothetical protein
MVAGAGLRVTRSLSLAKNDQEAGHAPNDCLAAFDRAMKNRFEAAPGSAGASLKEQLAEFFR